MAIARATDNVGDLFCEEASWLNVPLGSAMLVKDPVGMERIELSMLLDRVVGGILLGAIRLEDSLRTLSRAGKLRVTVELGAGGGR